MLHAVQDVASLLEPLSGTALTGGVLVSILLALRIAHVFRRFLKTFDGLLEARIGDRSGAAAIGAAAGLPVGLLPLLALLPLLPLLALLALLPLLAGLIRLITTLQLLH